MPRGKLRRRRERKSEVRRGMGRCPAGLQRSQRDFKIFLKFKIFLEFILCRNSYGDFADLVGIVPPPPLASPVFSCVEPLIDSVAQSKQRSLVKSIPVFGSEFQDSTKENVEFQGFS